MLSFFSRGFLAVRQAAFLIFLSARERCKLALLVPLPLPPAPPLHRLPRPPPTPCVDGARWAIRPFIVVSMVYVHMSLGMASPKTPTEMSPVRPPSSVFHRSIAVSLVAQAGIHVACMVFALRAAKAHSPEVGLWLPGCGSDEFRGSAPPGVWAVDEKARVVLWLFFRRFWFFASGGVDR